MYFFIISVWRTYEHQKHNASGHSCWCGGMKTQLLRTEAEILTYIIVTLSRGFVFLCQETNQQFLQLNNFILSSQLSGDEFECHHGLKSSLRTSGWITGWDLGVMKCCSYKITVQVHTYSNSQDIFMFIPLLNIKSYSRLPQGSWRSLLETNTSNARSMFTAERARSWTHLEGLLHKPL